MMKKCYESTLEEAVQANYRMAELSGILERQKRAGLLLSPFVLIILFLIPYVAFEFGVLVSLAIAVLMSLLYIFLYLITYKKQYRKETRKTMARALGTDQPVSCECEIDEAGLVFRKIGQEVRLSWDGVEQINDTGDAIEVIWKPLAITIFSKKDFSDPAELQEWVEFIRSHAGSGLSPGNV